MDPDLVITSCELKDRLKGKIPKVQTLLGVFREHNAKVKALVGREFAAGTLERYEHMKAPLVNFNLKSTLMAHYKNLYHAISDSKNIVTAYYKTLYHAITQT